MRLSRVRQQIHFSCRRALNGGAACIAPDHLLLMGPQRISLSSRPRHLQ